MRCNLGDYCLKSGRVCCLHRRRADDSKDKGVYCLITCTAVLGVQHGRGFWVVVRKL